MTDKERFEEWWTSRGNQPYSTLWTTGKSSYLAGLAEGRRLEREECAEFVSNLHVFGSCELQERQCNKLRDDIAAAIRGSMPEKLNPGEQDPRD